jgi:hypothetical protein
MATSIATLENPVPLVVLRAVVAGILIVVVFAVVVARESRPHLGVTTAPPSLSLPPIPVASGAAENLRVFPG